MNQSMSLRWCFAIAAAGFAIACGSAPDSGGAVPEINGGAISAESFSCVRTRASTPDPSAISSALASACGCSADPFHFDGCAERWNFVDCSGATQACVDSVISAGGYQNAPYFANTISVGSCSSLAVVYDPCTGGCKTFGPGGGGGGTVTLGDYCPKFRH